MESTDTSVEDHRRHHQQQPQLPPGFRFHPTDEELVVHYLMPRAQSAPLPISIIAEVDLYKFDPWELPEKAVFGEHEWYFFSPRDRKYPNGARPNRAATSGYWKATGTDKPIFGAGNKKLGVKKALVFYGGKPPRGHKTNWIMHEYRLADNNNSNKPMAYGYNSNNKKGSLRLDDWVLCRIYKKNNAHRPTDHEREDTMENMMMMGSMAVANSINPNSNSKSSSNYINTSHDDQGICLQGIMNGNRQGLQVDPGISMVPSAASPAANFPLKRALPSSLCWEGASSSKRVPGLQDDDNDYNNSNNSTEVLQQQTLLGAISEGLFRQTYQVPGLNWYS